jgi:hypothetical protein
VWIESKRINAPQSLFQSSSLSSASRCMNLRRVFGQVKSTAGVSAGLHHQRERERTTIAVTSQKLMARKIIGNL